MQARKNIIIEDKTEAKKLAESIKSQLNNCQGLSAALRLILNGYDRLSKKTEIVNIFFFALGFFPYKNIAMKLSQGVALLQVIPRRLEIECRLQVKYLHDQINVLPESERETFNDSLFTIEASISRLQNSCTSLQTQDFVTIFNDILEKDINMITEMNSIKASICDLSERVGSKKRETNTTLFVGLTGGLFSPSLASASAAAAQEVDVPRP